MTDTFYGLLGSKERRKVNFNEGKRF